MSMHIRRPASFAAASAAALLLRASRAQAGVIDPFNNGDMKSPVTQFSQLENILLSVVKWTYTLFFVAAVFFILVAAYNFVTAGGDKKKVDAAKAQLKYAAIGIAVALLASGAVTLIRNVITDVSGGAS